MPRPLPPPPPPRRQRVPSYHGWTAGRPARFRWTGPWRSDTVRLTGRDVDLGQPIAHFEIIGKDAAKLHRFYADLFGWQIGPAMPTMGNYALVDGASSGLPGGIGEDPTGPSRVTLYVQVSDVGAALDKAVSLGGKVLMPATDIPGGPTIAMFADPAGNITGLMKG